MTPSRRDNNYLERLRRSLPMKSIYNQIKLLHPAAKMPTRGSDRAAGYDIACVGGIDGLDSKVVEKLQDRDPASLAGMLDLQAGRLVLTPGSSFLFRTGIAMAIAPGYQCLLWDRSGLGGMDRVHRLAGVIDEDYRGEWLVRLVHLGDAPIPIQVGDRIVQGIFQERIDASFQLVTELPDSSRASAGFGASGK
jgi:dUTP pyrophosphatase